ncbi:MAG: DnaA/Hda family protein [Deltaproteobacteria bacterium]|nr:DnaA/Hda family protein [Deltaproteobacteria bacterium]MCX7953319.1 DnaA/Hda family protein [Deltaproteobacteria bacterium]
MTAEDRLSDIVTRILCKQSSIIRTAIRGKRIIVSTETSDSVLNITLYCQSSLIASLLKTSCDFKKFETILTAQTGYKVCQISMKQSFSLCNSPVSFMNQKKESLIDSSFDLNLKTFDTFLELQENRFALKVCSSIFDNCPVEKILLFGPSGNGKSHLCQSIVAEAKKRNIKSCYFHATNFVSLFVHSVYKNELQKLRKEILDSDIFILDDAQELAGKEKTQKELVFLLNTLEEKNAVVVFAANENIMLCQSLSTSLIEKLRGFLPCEIKQPSVDSKIKFLEWKLKGRVSKSDIKTIASYIENGIRQLETFVKNVEICINFVPSKILSSDDIYRLLKRFVKLEDETNNVNIPKLVEALASIYGIDPSLILSPTKNRKASKAKSILIVILKDHFKFTFKNIAGLLKFKDHSAPVKIYSRVKKSFLSLDLDSEIKKCIDIYSTHYQRKTLAS